MNFFSKVLEVAKNGIKIRFAYVADTWMSIVVNTVQIIIFYYIWMAVYGGNTHLHGISRSQIITYVILAKIIHILVSRQINLWISKRILTGQISMDLLRPFDFQLYTYSFRKGEFLCSLLVEGIPILVISMLLLSFSFPPSFVNTILFLISILLASTIAFFIEFAIGLLCFYTTNDWGLRITKDAVISFFSGALVPIAFFPEWLKVIANVLPFKDLVYTPISIYLGLVSGKALLEALLLQVIWIIILFVITRLFFYIAIKRVTVHGG